MLSRKVAGRAVKGLLSFVLIALALAYGPVGASADSIGPCGTPDACFGTIITLESTGVPITDNTYEVKLTIDTSGFVSPSGDTEYLAAVSMQAWAGGDLSGFLLTGAPGGTSDWISANGPAALSKDATTGGTLATYPALGGILMPDGTLTWTWDITLTDSNTLDFSSFGSHVQVLFLREDAQGGCCQERLISQDITLQTPEEGGGSFEAPAPTAIMLMGTALLGFSAVSRLRRLRHRK